MKLFLRLNAGRYLDAIQTPILAKAGETHNKV